jgi:dipeptidase
LERCHSARQALELITDLVVRHGQRGPDETDNVLLVADPREAYVVEAAGAHWAWAEVRELRAVSDVGLIRQDWQRLSPGLAEEVFCGQLWPDDGDKLDFGGCLGLEPMGRESALRRWGRAALLLEQQNGHIDAGFLRRLLADHYEGTSYEIDPQDASAGPRSLCRHAGGDGTFTVASCLVMLEAEAIPHAWCAFGPPCLSVYLPVFVDGDLPAAYGMALSGEAAPAGEAGGHPLLWVDQLLHTPSRWPQWRRALAQFQARIDQDTEEFLAEVERLAQQGNRDVVRRQTTMFMQSQLERLETEYAHLERATHRRPAFMTVE